MSELKRYKAYEFGGAYVYHIIEVDDYIAKLKAKLAEKDKEIERQNEAWNRLCKKYNKFVSLKQEFCEKFKDIELEITK